MLHRSQKRRCYGTAARTGFSLLELVIVIIIIGLLAAIAIPRFSRGNQRSAEAALRANLKILREAIDLYAAEHSGDWPSLRAAGDGIGPQNGEAFRRQMTWYTSETGEAVKIPDATHHLGPYIKSVPALPVGSRAGNNQVTTTNYFGSPLAESLNYGWQVEHYFGRIRPCLPETDVGSDGVPYYQW